MTNGNSTRLIISFALPILLSNIFQQLYSTADSIIVGRFLGTNSLAAVSSSGPLIYLMVSFFVGTSMGGGIVISKYFGARNDDKVLRAAHTAVLFALICGAIVSAIGLTLTPTLLTIMKTDPEIMPEATEYFAWYFTGSVFSLVYNMCTGIMNALGDSRRPLVYLIVSSVTNLVLDLMFVGLFRWGVWSAAFATVISQFASAVCCIVYLSSKKAPYRLRFKMLRLYGDMLKEILQNGLPAGVQNSVIGLANVFVQTNINSFGKIATAAFGAYAKIEGFAFLPINSFTMALTTFTGQNLGAQKYDRAKSGGKFGIITAVVMAEAIGVIAYFAAPILISMFDDSKEVVAYGVKQLRTECLFYGLLAFSHSIAAVCRGAGKATVPMTVMLSVWCVFRIIYISVAITFIHDIAVVYWAYPITWSISSVIFFIYYNFSDWVHGFDRLQQKRSRL